MNPYEFYIKCWNCSSFQQFYPKLESIARNMMGLDRLPFPLSALEHPPGNILNQEIIEFIRKCRKLGTGNNSDDDVIKLIKYLKENPPEESYGNPKLSDNPPTRDQWNLIQQIFYDGIDLPGSTHNPFGHLQYFSSFFIDMFFGNFTEFDDYIKSLSKEEIYRAMKKREGYCQQSPIFAPILGLRMVDIERSLDFTSEQVQEIRTMYSGCNEHMHLKIMKKLIKLGADVNAHDINGFTPLHYAVLHCNEGMVTVLLKHGANPNSESRDSVKPLSILTSANTETEMKVIDILIQYDSRLTDKEEIDKLRTSVETHGTKDLAIKVREAHPRDKEECEKCTKPTPKQCGACGKVYYCTPDCQKQDWKFHEISCQKKDNKQTNEVD